MADVKYNDLMCGRAESHGGNGEEKAPRTADPGLSTEGILAAGLGWDPLTQGGLRCLCNSAWERCV